jgi:hypothetical protein
MSRVELTIRRLVVHGVGSFDADLFREDLGREVASRIGEATNIHAITKHFHGDAAHHVLSQSRRGNASAGMREGPAAREVARRLVQ